LKSSILNKMDNPEPQSILSQRYNGEVPTLDPPADLREFAKESESLRQNASREVEKTIRERKDFITIAPSVEVKSEQIGDKKRGAIPTQAQPQILGSSSNSEWKITSGGEGVWNIGEGNIYTHGQGADMQVAAGSVSGESGVIYIQITRDPSTRAASEPLHGIAPTLPTSTQTTQYFRLGVVGGTPAILQKRFQPISLLENLFVMNGAFKMGNISMIDEALYDPPA